MELIFSNFSYFQLSAAQPYHRQAMALLLSEDNMALCQHFHATLDLFWWVRLPCYVKQLKPGTGQNLTVRVSALTRPVFIFLKLELGEELLKFFLFKKAPKKFSVKC